MQLLQEIKFSYATVKLFSNKLIRIEIFGDVTVSREQAKEMNDAIGVLSKGRESMIMILADEITRFSKEAQEFSASEEGLRYTIGDALVVKSMTQRITANLYLMVNKPKKPSKIFSSEKNALAWLEALECNLVPA
jgi:hypothetical protein